LAAAGAATGTTSGAGKVAGAKATVMSSSMKPRTCVPSEISALLLSGPLNISDLSKATRLQFVCSRYLLQQASLRRGCKLRRWYRKTSPGRDPLASSEATRLMAWW